MPSHLLSALRSGIVHMQQLSRASLVTQSTGVRRSVRSKLQRARDLAKMIQFRRHTGRDFTVTAVWVDIVTQRVGSRVEKQGAVLMDGRISYQTR